METNEYYVGTDLKFKLNLVAAGFSMERDNFKIEVYCNAKKISYTKDDLVEGEDGWYLAVDTDGFPPGTVWMVATAYVPDSDMPDGIRKEVTVCNLCTIKKTR